MEPRLYLDTYALTYSPGPKCAETRENAGVSQKHQTATKVLRKKMYS